jgi:hypothetical protein
VLTTIIKSFPGATPSGLRRYQITTISDGIRTVWETVAYSRGEAINQVRAAMAEGRWVE